jgi:hypothetical protein
MFEVDFIITSERMKKKLIIKPYTLLMHCQALSVRGRLYDSFIFLYGFKVQQTEEKKVT